MSQIFIEISEQIIFLLLEYNIINEINKFIQMIKTV